MSKSNKLVSVIDEIIKSSRKDGTLVEFSEEQFREKFSDPINTLMNKYEQELYRKSAESYSEISSIYLSF
jgi:hypothetical protein